jgi:hypothetical protein
MKEIEQNPKEQVIVLRDIKNPEEYVKVLRLIRIYEDMPDIENNRKIKERFFRRYRRE